jgi:hypothetical protein
VYTNNDLNVKDSKSISNSISNNDFVIIIKYSSNTYLPLMNSNGKHSFNRRIINIISKTFERIVLCKYKEPRDFIKTDNTDIADITESITDSINEVKQNLQPI